MQKSVLIAKSPNPHGTRVKLTLPKAKNDQNAIKLQRLEYLLVNIGIWLMIEWRVKWGGCDVRDRWGVGVFDGQFIH